MKRKDSAERIAELERLVDTLARRVDSLLKEAANYQPKPRVRLAVTWSKSEGTYPTVGNTFGILFVDGSVDQTGPGQKTTLYTEHTSKTAQEPKHFATTINDSFVDRNTPVFVLEQNNKLWILAAATNTCNDMRGYPLSQMSDATDALDRLVGLKWDDIAQTYSCVQFPGVYGIIDGSLETDLLWGDAAADVNITGIMGVQSVKNSIGETAAQGDYVLVWDSGRDGSDRFVLISVFRRTPVFVRGQLDSDMCSGYGVDVSGSTIGGMPMPNRSAFTNLYRLRAKSSDSALAAVERNATSHILQVLHKDWEIAQSYEYDNLNGTISAKTKTVSMPSCEEDGADDLVIQFQSKVVAQTITWSSPNIRLNRKDIWTLEAPTTAPASDLQLTSFEVGVGIGWSDPNLILNRDRMFAFNDPASASDDQVEFFDFTCP